MTVCDKHKFYDRKTNLPCKACLKELGESARSDDRNIAINIFRAVGFIVLTYVAIAFFIWLGT